MKIVKPTSLGILTRTFRWRGREHLGLAIPAMATLGTAPQLTSESGLWNAVGDALGGYALDAALPKPHAEFLVSANAYGRYCDETNACEVAVRFAGLEKRLRVSGAREWHGDSVTHAMPFDTLRVDWPNAYGGDGFADNPSGRGFCNVDGNGVQACAPLPHIEYPADRLTQRGQIVAPAAFTPVAPTRPQRRALYGQHDRVWQEQDCTGFPRTLDQRYFNVAPIDQQLPAHAALPDGAAYEITRLHPERETIAGVLPTLSVRAFVLRRNTSTLDELAMRLTTAWFIPHRERVVIVFHGVTEVAEFDASDIDCVLIAAENGAQSRSVEHYQRVLETRSDPRYGALHALRDGDLMSVSMVEPEQVEAGMHGDPSHGAWQKKLAQRGRTLARQTRLAAQGGGVRFADDAHDAVTAGPSEATLASSRKPELDDLAAFVQHQEQFAAALRSTLDNVRQQIERDYAANCPPPSPRRGPPEPCGATPPTRLDGTPAVQLDSAALAEIAREADLKLRDTYRQTAHHREAAPRVVADSAKARAIRERVIALHANRESLEGIDLTGADLSGLNLRGAQLSDALLENADLSCAELTGATLTGALLARADLTHTILRGATLTRANLSLAHCDHTDFSDATLDGALFEQTGFAYCKLLRASIERAQFRQCNWFAVDFSEATLSDLVFVEQRFSQVDFDGARIRKLAFVQCTADTVSFAAADIHGFACVETSAAGIRFDRATLRQACFVKDTVLNRADFSQATLSEVNLRHAHAPGANFSHARISQSDFSDVNLQDANLQHARIDNGYLVRTDLRGAKLERADLIGGYLRRADLRGAGLQHANLFRANFAEATLDDPVPHSVLSADECGERTQFAGAYLDQSMFYPLANRS